MMLPWRRKARLPHSEAQKSMLDHHPLKKKEACSSRKEKSPPFSSLSSDFRIASSLFTGGDKLSFDLTGDRDHASLGRFFEHCIIIISLSLS
jgi:hypothetical protein